MEIKDNKLIIDIPKGMEVDKENTDLTKGIVRFKEKPKKYQDIFDALVKNLPYGAYRLAKSNECKLIALDKLMNIAKYYNGDWKPNWNSREEAKYYIYYNHKEGRYKVNSTARINWGDVYFRFRDNAELVMDNPNFKSILDTIYKE